MHMIRWPKELWGTRQCVRQVEDCLPAWMPVTSRLVPPSVTELCCQVQCRWRTHCNSLVSHALSHSCLLGLQGQAHFFFNSMTPWHHIEPMMQSTIQARYATSRAKFVHCMWMQPSMLSKERSGHCLQQQNRRHTVRQQFISNCSTSCATILHVPDPNLYTHFIAAYVESTHQMLIHGVLCSSALL